MAMFSRVPQALPQASVGAIASMSGDGSPTKFPRCGYN